MVRIKLFVLLTVLLVFPNIPWATEHSISYNAAIVIDLQDNDEINLVDFPVEWGYNRVVLGLNSVPGIQLSGFLVANDCYHKLHSYYEEFDIDYTNNIKIVYHGPAQRLPIQWWVDVNPVISSCKNYSEILRKDSVFTALYNIADSIFSDQTKDYNDLGDINTETYFEGTSAKFKITHLPEWFFNRIYVQVESMDKHELDGAVYSGGTKADVEGSSSQFVLEPKTMLGPIFELAFPSYRKVKLKWWTEVQVPSKQQIETKQKEITPDSVEVEYIFEDEFYSKNSVKIVYNKHKLSDDKVPVIKKFSFNPYGNKKSKNFGVRGDVYEIDASTKTGDSVTVAIPLGSDFQSGRDLAMVEYFDENEDEWVEYPVDSIVDGYVYLNQPQRVLSVAVGIGPISISGTVPSLSKIAKGVGHGLSWVYNSLKKAVCDYPEKLKTFFGAVTLGLSSINTNWDPPQGTVNYSLLQEGQDLLSFLDYKRKNEQLVKLSEACAEAVDKETCMWQRTRDNLDVLLADAVLSYFNFQYVREDLKIPEYKFRLSLDGKAWLKKNVHPSIKFNYDDYFMVNSNLFEKAAWFVSRAKSCLGTFNITGKAVGRLMDFVEGVTSLSWSKTCRAILGVPELAPEFFVDAMNCADFGINHENLLDGYQDKLIAVSEAMVRISLLAWLKKSDGFRDYTLLRYKATYEGILAWLELAAPFLKYNNIAIKAYGSLALYEYIHFGTDENLEKVNFALSLHYGDDGGYSEGTGYSQYIWEDLPYVLAALKDAYKQQNKNFSINSSFLKSPDYMFEFSRPVGIKGGENGDKHYGMIPVEVDDGVTYNPDYLVWAKLKDDPKYIAVGKKYPLKFENGKIKPMVAFGYPDMSLYLDYSFGLPDINLYIDKNFGYPDIDLNIDYDGSKILYRGRSLWGDFKDGIGMITAVNDGDTVALSMIAENGKMWKRGQGHDQQDNLSITLTSSKNGFLIQDPGYSGFGERSSVDKFHRYNDHNVLVSNYVRKILWGQDDNREISFSEAISRLSDFTDEFVGVGLSSFISFWKMSFGVMGIVNFETEYNYSVEGGEMATVLDRKINEPRNGVIGFTAKTKINKPKGDMCENYRTIMYFGGNFWVIDRPRTDVPMMWLANSPVERWEDLKISGLNLYGSWDGKLTPDRSLENDDDARILQNASRSDFIIGNDGKNYLKNYKYIATDTHSKSYVMTYSLGNENFAMDRTYCPITAYQCFVNTSKNMRVIVPPAGESFKLCDVLPKNECSGEARSTGITMFVKTPLGEWTTRWVLDGDLWAGEFFDFKIVSATVSRTFYVYEKLDGTLVKDPYKGTYLPALPILLLR